MDERPEPSDDLIAELRNLGLNLKAVLQAGWEREERKKAQAEVEAAMAQVASALSGAGKDFIESPTGKKLKAEVEDLGDKVRRAELQAKARAEFLEALRKVNEELTRLAEKWRQPASPGDRSG